MVKKRETINDRTLILRINHETLNARLRQKMTQAEEEVTKAAAAAALAAANNSKRSNDNNNMSSFLNQHQMSISSSSMATSQKQENKLLDLPGVTCEPARPSLGWSTSTSTSTSASTNDDPTLWEFVCDNVSYPARLTNLPCPVELHKTHDHAMYYKCTDVAQMLIVYEDIEALQEEKNNSRYKVDDYPSYYHSGLTPPTARIVKKRFKKRIHNAVAPATFEEIQQVEAELLKLIDEISADSSKQKQKKNPKPALNKVIEEVEEVLVPYEPWMDENGNVPEGIEFNETDNICKNHPEVWLDPQELKEEEDKILQQQQQQQLPGGGGGGGGFGSISPKGRKKSSTPDAPMNPLLDNKNKSSDSVASSKKKKTTKTKKKKKKKDPTPAPAAAMATAVPNMDSTSNNQNDVLNLDEEELNLTVLDDFLDLNDDDLLLDYR